MSYAKAIAVGLLGLVGHLVEVEADLAVGLPGFTLTGLPDTALNEARDRVRAALVNSGEHWPNRRITVNLLPASLPKHGSGFGLGIALTVLGGAGKIPMSMLDGVALIGELGLDGAIRPVPGVLPEEWPSCIDNSGLAMPGPSSMEITSTSPAWGRGATSSRPFDA